MLRIFEGSNGYYVAEENADGFHREPADNGSRLGFDREAAEQELLEAEEEGEYEPWGAYGADYED